MRYLTESNAQTRHEQNIHLADWDQFETHRCRSRIIRNTDQCFLHPFPHEQIHQTTKQKAHNQAGKPVTDVHITTHP